ncbi:hypothetical protein BUALT_Bualt08G0149900 [Buddleja alternifolia]|uniref:RING-type E3 ubiquitin transferase n=1 Tax=Buddleja alternifolia TaxID=168488 RepID=A0AAV6XHH2_9LAMI|nr:hypothetical protein BUALT_Bualt08G0149900 [Buddleja alternifolia]
MMSSSYENVKNNSISDQEIFASNGSGSTTTGTSNAAGNCCSRASPDLKLYQAFIFSVPIFFTFILLFLFYLFYLRRRRVDWSSLRMRTANSVPTSEISDDISRCELGLKKELREMLPIIVFKESFSVKDTQCAVCLGDYQAEDRLQQIPACGHTFHMDCIDLWLATHTTCPLCRQSLLAITSHGEGDIHVETNNTTSCNAENGDETSHQNDNDLVSNEDPQTSQQSPESGDRDERVVPAVGRTERNRDLQYDDVDRDMENAK